MPKPVLALAVIATCSGPCDDTRLQPTLIGVCPEVRVGTTVDDIQLGTDERVPALAATVVDDNDRLDDYLTVTVIDGRLGVLSITANEPGTGYVKVAYRAPEGDVHWLWYGIRASTTATVPSNCQVATSDETLAQLD